MLKCVFFWGVYALALLVVFRKASLGTRNLLQRTCLHTTFKNQMLQARVAKTSASSIYELDAVSRVVSRG